MVTESVLANLSPFPSVESAYQFWLQQSQQLPMNDYASRMAQFFYQFRDPQIRWHEEAEARRIKEQRKRHTRQRRYGARKSERHGILDAHYLALGLTPGASKEQIRAAYKDKAKIHHPDKGGRQEDFVRIREAYEVLTKGETGNR